MVSKRRQADARVVPVGELKATPEDIRYAYRLLLGREPDAQGLANHVERMHVHSPSTVELAQGFFGSPEFIARFGCLVHVSSAESPPRSNAFLQCQACTQAQIESATFFYWAQRLKERPGGLHRKLWEWCFISQALFERNALRAGSSGLGFAVGNEPLSSMFASMGARIVATDVDQAVASEAGWVDSNQHAAGFDQLNARLLCDPATFATNARFQEADMRTIPNDLRDFDFLWSSCALEHLGSLANGADFVVNAMSCLRSGGIAVHTTELNCDSNEHTVETGGSVIYRERDLIDLASRLRDAGHLVEPLNFHTGDSEADRYVDEPPYGGKAHIKLRIGAYASTSFGLIIRKHGAT